MYIKINKQGYVVGFSGANVFPDGIEINDFEFDTEHPDFIMEAYRLFNGRIVFDDVRHTMLLKVRKAQLLAHKLQLELDEEQMSINELLETQALGMLSTSEERELKNKLLNRRAKRKEMQALTEQMVATIENVKDEN